MSNTGMVRVAAATPLIRVADIEFNKSEILKVIHEANEHNAAFVVLPELTITGYTVGDLLHQPFLYEKQLEALLSIMEDTSALDITAILGCYIRHRDFLFNCAAVIRGGEILGIVPKTMLPNQSEFTEMRWFDHGSANYPTDNSICLRGQQVPFGSIIFDDEVNGISFGVEICRDIWTSVSPGSFLCNAGAHIIFNASASTEQAGKAMQRRLMLSTLAQKNCCGYVYVSSGVGESTTDGVLSGHRLIIDSGNILCESPRFERETSIDYSEIDVARIRYDRIHNRNNTTVNEEFYPACEPIHITVKPLKTVGFDQKLIRKYAPNPWLPVGTAFADDYCEDVINIQSAGLAKRMEHIGAKKTLLGVSGGLDSTMALLVACEAHKLLGLPASNVIAVTLPGFGTSDRTYENAISMMKELGVDLREISIKEAVLKHFEDIGHDRNIHDLTYENAQARERTQILMDLAGKEGALMVGTGDLSEIALGWCTYNGDHMSMYSVNGTLPKTMLPFIIRHVQKTRYAESPKLAATLNSVIDTPISPELLPPDESGKIAQKTEDKVGPYVLHDFFIFHMILSGWEPRKMVYMAVQAFDGIFDEAAIRKWLRTFYYRFFASQFKRNCAPDGPKATAISFSSRGDLHMPSDVVGKLWIKEMDEM